MGPQHDWLIADWQANAVGQHEAHRRFLCSLKLVDDPAAVDALTQRLHAAVFAEIDCTRCANCCKTAAVSLDDADIDRIATHLGISRDKLIAAYLAAYPVEGRYHMATMPCPFLGSDDRCTIYDVRPEICRSYPNTECDGFATRSYQHASNTLMCPAVYHIVKRMRRKLASPPV
jgi:Fe-S-cluster containining protein